MGHAESFRQLSLELRSVASQRCEARRRLRGLEAQLFAAQHRCQEQRRRARQAPGDAPPQGQGPSLRQRLQLEVGERQMKLVKQRLELLEQSSRSRAEALLEVTLEVQLNIT